MLEIEHRGFIARVSIDGGRLRGKIRDTHELLLIAGETVSELKRDFERTIETYCARCKKRGVSPFDTPDGKSTTELDAEFLDLSVQALGETEAPGSDRVTPPAWPHKHNAFFEAKASLLIDQNDSLRGQHKPISKSLRLPIDAVVDALRQRGRSPSLADVWRDPERERDLPGHLRFRLSEAFRRVADSDPRNRGRAREFNLKFVENAKRLSAEATTFLSRYGSSEGPGGFICGFPKFSRGVPAEETQSRYETCVWAEQGLILFLERLQLIMSWVYADMNELAPAYGGRPRLDWKHNFVAAIAELWVELTFKRPSSKPDGLFAELVDAAWRSGGSDMPAVDWTDTVRAFCRGLKKGRETPSAEG